MAPPPASPGRAATMSKEQVDRTKAAEQFKAAPYSDGRTGQSIGYGFHVNAWPEKAKDIRVPITKAQADELFDYVDSWNANYMAKKLGIDVWNSLDQRQIDALLSVAYNTGAPGLWGAIESDLRTKNFEKVAQKIETHATSGNQGVVKVDLSPRRRRDAELFRAGSM
ncbi:hypothetical protein AYO20_10214 [Fonsecaea nubica]|uniref:Lysozyme n=1 Tax=Fonsecaea nubica TaxID=856822 RepID=A0A178CBR1_9EURO|nr:hypothetical protein AYO20_10214 [Fonsecaea nubica]OAL26161.1 hypothetical protein AYO20_10214 [Fonsecaea nubica]